MDHEEAHGGVLTDRQRSIEEILERLRRIEEQLAETTEASPGEGGGTDSPNQATLEGLDDLSDEAPQAPEGA